MNDRRDFLKAGARLAATAGVGALVVETIQGCGSTTKNSPTTPTVTANSNNIATISFEDFPNLEIVTGCYKVNIKTAFTTKTVYVTRVSSGRASTVTVVCTHEGCTLDKWNGSAYPCPCHGSSYDEDGSVVTGPAVTSLTSYVSTVTSTGIQVLMT